MRNCFTAACEQDRVRDREERERREGMRPGLNEDTAACDWGRVRQGGHEKTGSQRPRRRTTVESPTFLSKTADEGKETFLQLKKDCHGLLLSEFFKN